MSDIDVQRRLREIEHTLDRLITREVSALYLPWAQRVLNPFPLASSGNIWGEMTQPWAVTVLAFYCSVYVATTNNGTNYWTITLSSTPSGNAVASISTAAIAANTFTRLSDLTITQPASTDVEFYITPTATGAPGAIYIVPAVELVRTG